MAHRDVARVIGACGEPQADNLRPHRGGTRRLYIQREAAGRPQALHECAERRLVLNERRDRVDGNRSGPPFGGLAEQGELCAARSCPPVATHRLLDLVEQAAKAQLVEHGQDALPLEALQLRRWKIQLDRQVADDRGQPFGHRHLLAERLQQRALFVWDRVQIFVQRLDAAVRGQQPGGGLVPDTRNAWDVVRAVAAQRLEVHQLMRFQPESLADGLLVVHDRVGETAPRGQHPDVRPDQLKRVHVARQDHYLHALLLGLLGQRPEQVVRLVALEPKDGNVHGVQ